MTSNDRANAPDPGRPAVAEAPEVVWFLHADGVPLTRISGQIAALDVLDKPRAYFDHDAVMFEQAKRLGVGTFSAYVDALAASLDAAEQNPEIAGQRSMVAKKPLSLLVPMADLGWLRNEPAIGRLLARRCRFVHVTYRDPALQAIVGLLSKSGSAIDCIGSETPSFKAIADNVASLADREAAAAAWLGGRGHQVAELMIEELAAPGVAALRHLLNDLGLALPPTARVNAIDSPNPGDLALARHFREAAGKRHWEHAIPLRAPHWVFRVRAG
ncbi:MAG: hypothetical protein ACR2Q4_19840 [Geminicoccaceae bacterium]